MIPAYVNYAVGRISQQAVSELVPESFVNVTAATTQDSTSPWVLVAFLAYLGWGHPVQPIT
eukprot:11392612-Karenia_brevis.AAC.1